MSAIDRTDVAVSGGALATFRLGHGPERADPVVAVHGITANSHCWLAVARALDGRAELVAVDLRGRAASNALPPPYGMAAYSRDLLAVLDHYGLERAVLVGHSLGAYAVARFATDHRDRVSAVLLVDGGLAAPLPDDVDPQAVVAAVLGPGARPAEAAIRDPRGVFRLVARPSGVCARRRVRSRPGRLRGSRPCRRTAGVAVLGRRGCGQRRRRRDARPRQAGATRSRSRPSWCAPSAG